MGGLAGLSGYNVGANVMSAFFQQKQCLRPQEHIAVDLCKQLIEFELFFCSEYVAFFLAVEFVQTFSISR